MYSRRMMLNELSPGAHLQIIQFNVLKVESGPKILRNPENSSAFGVTGEVSDFAGAVISRGEVSRVAKSLVRVGPFCSLDML